VHHAAHPAQWLKALFINLLLRSIKSNKHELDTIDR
jgi:hypothetical protein